MEQLWAPWRSAYLKSLPDPKQVDEDSCVFCLLASAEGDEREKLVLARTEHSFVVMNRYPYNNGHLLILPLSHKGELEEVDDVVLLDLQKTLVKALKVLKDVYGCEGLNIGMNIGRAAGAGIPAHLHYHLMPRWAGDTNFATTVGQLRVIPEDLYTGYDQLKPHFDAAFSA
ncbi:MAG: HIT family hydrolase [Myxococcales bacterium]|nr:HIT family hydrolase [Myxococcales bacterium]